MIREFQISAAPSEDDVIYEPLESILKVSVIGDCASLDWEELPEDEGGPVDRERARVSFQVSARSLLIALRAAWEDDHPTASANERPGP